MEESDLSYLKTRLMEQYRRAYRNVLRVSKRSIDTPTEDLVKEAAELKGFIRGIKRALVYI